MKSKERHDLRRNELLELLSDPGRLVRKHGLTVLVAVAAAVVAISLIIRASGAEDRKWRRAWLPLERAVEANSEEQLRTISDRTKNEELVRAWASVKQGELLYNKSLQSEDSSDQVARKDLLSQAVNCYKQALKIGHEWHQVVGQATIGLGLCYENLGKFELAGQQYETIISQGEELFAGSVWLNRAQGRKKFLEGPAKEKVVFGP